MRIALVSLARRGGMVHFLAELANALAPLCVTTVVFSTAATSSFFSRKLNRVPVNTGSTALQGLLRAFNPIMWYGLARRILAQRSDVIHIVGVHEWNPLVAVLCRLLGRPLVYTVHDAEAHPGAPWAIRVADWLTARMADEIVVLTRLGRKRLVARGIPESKITVIPHPMYSLFLRWRPRKVRPSRVILCFGRMQAYKGLDVLAEAFLAIRSQIPGWKLILAGSGPVPSSLQGLASMDVEVINRYLPERDVARLVQQASFLVLPYTSATQSGVIALAQAFRRPVITTSTGGLKEAVLQGETGLLVPPNSVSALARAIRTLARDRGRRARMQRATAELGETRWRPALVARAHARLYARLLRRAGRE